MNDQDKKTTRLSSKLRKKVFTLENGSIKVDVEITDPNKKYKFLKKGMVVSQSLLMTTILGKKFPNQKKDIVINLPYHYKLVGEVISKRESWYGSDTAFEITLKRISRDVLRPNYKFPSDYKVWQLSNGYIYIFPFQDYASYKIEVEEIISILDEAKRKIDSLSSEVGDNEIKSLLIDVMDKVDDLITQDIAHIFKCLNNNC